MQENKFSFSTRIFLILQKQKKREKKYTIYANVTKNRHQSIT